MLVAHLLQPVSVTIWPVLYVHHKNTGSTSGHTQAPAFCTRVVLLERQFDQAQLLC